MDITGFPENINLNPEGYRELALVKNFRQPRSGVTLNVDTFTLLREAKERLEKWIDEEQGRFENVPATITTDSGMQMPFYLDLKEMTRGLERCVVGIQARKSDGHFFENADYLTFELLSSQGFLTPDLIARVPYIVVPDDVAMKAIFATGQTLVLTYQAVQAVFEIAKSAAAFSDVFGFTGILTAVLQLVAVIIFFALVVVSLIQAVKRLKELIFPEVRYLKAFSDYDLIRKGCEYLGYTLESSVLENDLRKLHTCGIPQAQENKSIWSEILVQPNGGFFNKGYPTGQDTTPTLGSLIQFLLTTYNLKIFVYNGVVKIEKRSYFMNTANVNVIPTLSNQSEHNDEYTYNDDEAWGRTYDHWLVDYSDLHSPDINDGVQSEKITTQINTINPDLVRLTGLKENSAPFALGSRKSGLNIVEKTFKTLFGLFDKTIGAFNGNSNSSNVDERVGILVIEKEYFSTTKKLWGSPVGGILKQGIEYKTALSMDFIYNIFKKDLEVNVNNYKVKEMRVPFTDENFTSLLQNNFVNYQEEGEQATKAEVVSIEWYDRKYSANLIILVPDNSAFNTQVKTIV